MKRSLIFSFLLLLISSILIFFKFNLVPQNISFDEIAFTKLALSLDNSKYIPYSNLATGHSTLYFYIILVSFKIFGVTNFALRFPSAIFGILSILVFFVLLKNVLKEGINPYFSFLGAFILTTSRWFINFSRFSFEATFLLLMELLSLLLILFFIKKENNLFLFLSAVFAGLSFLSYTPGRIFFLLPAFLLLIKKTKIKYYFFYFITFIIVSSPLTIYFVKHSDIRFQEISILSQKNSIYSKIKMFSENAQKTALMFNFKGDLNGRHNFPGKPSFNPILGTFFVIGLIITTKELFKFPNNLFLFYFILGLVPTFFTLPPDNPNMLRLFTTLPSSIYFVIYGIKNILTVNHKKYLPYIFVGLIIMSSILELRTYFKYQSRVFRNSFEVKCQINEVINKIPKRCLVSKNEF